MSDYNSAFYHPPPPHQTKIYIHRIYEFVFHETLAYRGEESEYEPGHTYSCWVDKGIQHYFISSMFKSLCKCLYFYTNVACIHVTAARSTCATDNSYTIWGSCS